MGFTVMTIENAEFQDALSDTLDYLYDWEKEARVDFEYASLQQWSKDDKDKLEAQGRPALVFDRTRPIIASVAGTEITQRYEPKFLPRDADLGDVDIAYSEAANKTYRWIRDRGDFAHHESLAFQSALICGVGCTELYLDYEEDPDGVIKMARVPIFEIGWDPSSIDPNYMDARYVIRDRWVDEDEVIQRFGRDVADKAKLIGEQNAPGRSRGFLSSLFAREIDDPRRTYFENRSGKYYDTKRRQIRVWEMCRKERTYVTRIVPPAFLGGDDLFVPKKEAEEFIRMYQAQIMQYNVQAATMGMPPEPPLRFIEDFPTTKVWRSYHSGNEVIDDKELPMHYFPYQFITAFEDWSDQARRYHFGLMRSMRDPQMYANKFFSHMVHMWASNPKGAIMFEEDLFQNMDEARDSWAAADGWLPVDIGKLQGPSPKYQIIPSSINYNGVQMLLQHSIGSVSAAAGISEQYTVGNPTDLRRTAASAVSSVKESNQVTISQPFDALRLYKRIQGRLILDHVAAYVPVNQLTRLLNPEEQMEFIQPAKEGKLHQQYEVIAEEAPASKSKQMDVFNKIMETSFIPQLMEIGVTVPPELAKYFPFPPDINAEFEKVLTATKEIMELQNNMTIMDLQAQMAMMQQQLEQAGLAGEAEASGMEAEIAGNEASVMEAGLATQQMGMEQAMMQMDPMGAMMPPDPGMEGEEPLPPEE
jgi:hypothetical protein